MNKKGIEVSITFLVGLIIGLVLFGFGMIFAYNIVSNLDKIQAAGLPDEFEIEEQLCVQRADKVCVPLIKEEILTAKTKSFGVIINNIAGEERTFRVYPTFSFGIDDEGNDITSVTMDRWTFDSFDPLTIENNKHEIVEVPMRPPAGTVAGTYVFNINVCYNGPGSKNCPSGPGKLYSPTNQITVVVP